MSDKSQLEVIKTNVRSLIQSQTSSFYTILDLQKDYKNVMGHQMPLLGHQSVEHFLRDMPDVVKINGYGPQAYLEYIPSSKSKHIGEMIKNQKQNNGKRRGKQKRKIFHSQPEKGVKFPQYSDESDWDNRAIAKNELQQTIIQPAKEVYLNTNLVNDAPTAVPKKYNNPRTEFLFWMRKKYEQRESNATQSSNSSQSSESTADSKNIQSRTITYKGYRDILQKIRQSEIEEKAKETSENPTPNANTHKFDSPNASTHCMQLPRRAKPQITSNSNFYENDEEEAVPAAAMSDIIERMNSAQISQVLSVAPSTEISIPQFNVHEKFKTGEILSLIIAEIDNPLLFYFLLFEEIDDFHEFQNELQNTYSNILARDELRMPEYNLHAGAVCAAYFEDKWHRAMICSVPQDPNEFSKIKLFLVDRGLYCELTNRNLKFLAKRFSHLPAQAICARLANIKPKAYSCESKASIFFQEMVQEKHLYGYVKSIGLKNQQVELILLDTNVEPKRRINEELIRAGLVEKV